MQLYYSASLSDYFESGIAQRAYSMRLSGHAGWKGAWNMRLQTMRLRLARLQNHSQVQAHAPNL